MNKNFVSARMVSYAISALLSVLSIAAYLFLPINLGIDMTGGTQMEYDYKNDINIEAVKTAAEEVRASVNASGSTVINSISAYGIAGEKKFVVEAGFDQDTKLTEPQMEAAKASFKDGVTAKLKAQNQDVLLIKYVNVGAAFGDYIKKTAYMTIFLMIFSISLYIAYAFRGSIEGASSFSFAAVTAVSLVHDVLLAFGFYVITSFFFPEFKIDTFFITAMLTVLGYSINDTIVVMDRIRSNLRLPENKKKPFGVLINESINETMTRSLFTSFTVFIVLVALFFFGPLAIKGFILALIYGTVVGTYSSVLIAAPLLLDINGEPKEETK